MWFESDYEKRRRESRETFEFFFGPLDEPLTLAQRASHFARVCVSLYAGCWTAYYLGTLGLGPPLSLLEGVSSPVALPIWLLRFILFLVWWIALGGIGFGIVSWVIGSLSSVKARLVAYAVVLVVFALPAFFQRVHETRALRDARPVEFERPGDIDTEFFSEAPTQPDLTEEMKSARTLAARIEALLKQRKTRWRSDIDTAGVTGPAGAIPDFLEVKQAAGQIEVTNSTDDPVCVQVARIYRSATAAGGYERCVVGTGNCREIAAHGVARFQEYRTSAPECATAPLEFRVGSPERPEPTWWTQTALAEYDAKPPTPNGSYALDERELKARVEQLEAELADTGRAERWRQRRER